MNLSPQLTRLAARISGFGKENLDDILHLVADGKYLQYTPETGNLSELGRQPQGRFTGTTGDLLKAKEQVKATVLLSRSLVGKRTI